MVLNLSAMPSWKISSYTSNSIAHRDRIAASTYAAATSSRSKTIRSQKGRLEVPAGNYCLLVDSNAHQKLFTWGTVRGGTCRPSPLPRLDCLPENGRLSIWWGCPQANRQSPSEQPSGHPAHCKCTQLIPVFRCPTHQSGSRKQPYAQLSSLLVPQFH